jgi:hypothetical protein
VEDVKRLLENCSSKYYPNAGRRERTVEKCSLDRSFQETSKPNITLLPASSSLDFIFNLFWQLTASKIKEWQWNT